VKENNPSPEQIVRIFQEADAKIASGSTVEQICKELGITADAYYNWRKYYVRMKHDNQIKVGRHAAIAGILLILSMPLFVISLGCIVNGISIIARLREPESSGFLLLALIIAYVLHLPLLCLLLVFARALRQWGAKTIVATYVAILIGLGLSGLYFSRWFISFPRVKYVPAVLYVALLLPFLTKGLLGTIKKARIEQ
jgi:uncharacterized membrane protein YhaH (DUF805 family)